VEDVSIVLDVVADHDPEDPASANVAVPNYYEGLVRSPRGVVIGVPYRWIEDQVTASPEIRRTFDAALRIFRELGSVIRPIDLPPLIEYEDTKKVIAACELFAIYGQALRRSPELFGSSFRYRAMAGGLIRAEDYILALQKRANLARATQEALATVEAVMTPTEELPSPLQPTRPEVLFTSQGYLTAFNVSGHPALALCMGYAEGGLPMSLQIVGGMFAEETVLSLGYAYEKATAWRDTRPLLH
jgi:aspartyl-tRNA(Asn)/glutamyl-tRNA(Gln) amidotransferase subunit A